MTLILLGCQSRVILPVLQAARALGGRRPILLGTRETRDLRWSAWCGRHVLADFADLQGTAEQLDRLAREHPRAVIVPCDCGAIRLVHRLGARVPLPTTPCPTPDALQTLDDKWQFHLLCEAAGLPVPATVRAAGKHKLDFSGLVAVLGLPFIVKPANSSGSEGVVVVRRRQDLVEQIQQNATYVQGPLVVQRYIEGWDIDVDLLAVDGELRAVTTHRVTGCWMDFIRHPALEDMAAVLCRITRYSGPMNLDARVEAATGRVFLIESNPRFWASLAMPAACGLNFLAESLCAAEPHDAEPRRPALARCNQRHPLLRPREWWRAVADPGSQGLLLRATLFDPYTLGAFAAGLPQMARRALQRTGRGLRRALRVSQAPGPVRP